MVVRLSWFSGRALATQARGVLSLSPMTARLLTFCLLISFVFSPNIMWVQVVVPSFPGLPCFCSLVCVLYNTRKQKSSTKINNGNSSNVHTATRKLNQQYKKCYSSYCKCINCLVSNSHEGAFIHSVGNQIQWRTELTKVNDCCWSDLRLGLQLVVSFSSFIFVLSSSFLLQ